MEADKIYLQKYHSRNTRLNITNQDEIISIIEKSKYVTLAMITPEGEPYAVALSHGYDRERNCFYFHTGYKGKKVDAISCNPRVCAFVLNDQGYISGKCRHIYQSVICYGTIAEISDREEKRQALIKMFYSLESSKEDAERMLKMRNINGIDLDSVNMLRMDIDGFSGKASR